MVERYGPTEATDYRDTLRAGRYVVPGWATPSHRPADRERPGFRPRSRAPAIAGRRGRGAYFGGLGLAMVI